MRATGARKPGRAILTTAGVILAGGLLLVVAVAVVGGGLGLTAPGAVEGDGTVYGLTIDRAFATSAAFVALAGTMLGGIRFLRAVRGTGGTGRRGALVALALSAAGGLVGAIVVITADGGPGTGNGIIGGYVAALFGVVGGVLAGLALHRVGKRS